MGEAHTSEECHQLAGKFASLLSDQRGEVILLFEGEESMEEVTGGALDAFRSLYHILSKTKVRVFGWDDKKSVKTITNGLEEPVALAYARLKGIVAEAVALGEADQAINKQMQETYNTLTQGRDRFLEMLQKFCAEDKLSEESFA